jgi:nucleotide-binding universal stress UspA family protein
VKHRILLATDGAPAAAGAVRIARALAETRGAHVGVVSVVEPFPIDYPDGADAARVRANAERRAVRERMDRVIRSLADVGGGATGWAVTVSVGSPAPTVVRAAERMNATLIVLGAGRHELADRWLGTETALRVMRVSHLPVLAVPEAASVLPRQAVAAIDFTRLSVTASRVAAGLLAPGGLLHLVHVAETSFAKLARRDDRAWIDAHLNVAAERLTELVRGMDADDRVAVRSRVLQGDPARKLLDYAAEVGADLIAAGSQGAGFVGRLLLGSVSTRLVRGASVPVLVAPPTTVPAELPPMDDVRTIERAAVAAPQTGGATVGAHA